MCVSRTGNHISIDKANFTRKLKQNLNLVVYAFFVKEKKNNGALLCACNGSLCHLDLIYLQVMTNFNKRIILSVDNISFKNCVKRLCLYKYYHPGTSKADNYSCAYTPESTWDPYGLDIHCNVYPNHRDPKCFLVYWFSCHKSNQITFRMFVCTFLCSFSRGLSSEWRWFLHFDFNQ